MSIWDGLDRGAFERQIATLYARTQYPADPTSRSRAPIKTTETLSRSGAASRLPWDVEARLADDLAFLAAWQRAPACVAAVAVGRAEGERGGFCCVAVAANGGVAEEVRVAFAGLCRSFRECALLSELSRCATARPLRLCSRLGTRQALNAFGPETSRQDCIASCFDIVVGLNRNRIFGRLGSAKHRRHQNEQMFPKTPMAARLGSVIAQLSRPRNAANPTARRKLVEELKDLKVTVDNVDSALPKNEIDALKAVIRAASALVDSSTSLGSRLEACGLSRQPKERREVRQIKAIARYSSACSFLVSAARSYRTQFEHVALRFVEAPPVEIWPAGSGNKHFVHAEMQLLLWHETNPGAPEARYFGVSKKACFLCNCMIQAYGKYEVASTHGELHTQWTIRSQDPVADQVVVRVRKALRSTQNDVARALKQARATKPRRAAPVQSVVNSCNASLRTASASTIKAAPLDLSGREQTLTDLPSTIGRLQPSSSQSRGAYTLEQVSEASSHKTTEKLSGHSSTSTLKASTRCQPERPELDTSSSFRHAERYTISPGQTVLCRLEWLELHVQLDQPTEPQEREDIVCRISGYTYGSDAPGVPETVIDVRSLALGEQREYKFPAGSRTSVCLLGDGPSRAVCLELYRGTVA